MSELSELLSPLSSMEILTLNKLLERKPDGVVTVCGFERRENKFGVSPVFKAAEGFKFYGAGKLLKEKVMPLLEKKYGSDEAINAALGKKPQVWKIGAVIVLKNGNRFRPIEFLGDYTGVEMIEEPDDEV